MRFQIRIDKKIRLDFYIQELIRETFSDDSDAVEDESCATPSEKVFIQNLPQADNDEEILTKPEFEGLWDQKHTIKKTERKVILLIPTNLYTVFGLFLYCMKSC